MSEEVQCISYLLSEHLTRSQTNKGRHREEGETETDRYTLGEEEGGRKIWRKRQFNH